VRGVRSDGKPKKKSLPARRKSVTSEPIPGSVGELIYTERRKRTISQQAMAEKLKTAGGKAYNGRVSQLELGKTLPTDRELPILAKMLGLSIISLREKRDASAKSHRSMQAKRRSSLLAPKPPERVAAKRLTRAAEPPPAALAIVVPEPAGPAELADWIGMVDASVARMPVDPEKRRRWLNATVELFKLRSAQ
jgi:transcriptional regulator with XRE-family HTH domain